jgi:P-type E1-E2 ATPase
MLDVTIPGHGQHQFAHLVLDLNGTLTVDGQIEPSTADRIRQLCGSIRLHVVTADTRGTGTEIAERLGLDLYRLRSGQEATQKRDYVTSLGVTKVVALGNGANDVLMLKAATLGIAVLGPEGLATACLTAADIVVPGITAGLDLLLHPQRLTATWRC